MMFFKNLTIGAKLIALVVFLEVIVVFTAWNGISVSNDVNNDYKHLVATDSQAAVSANALGMHFLAARGQHIMTMSRSTNEATEKSYAEVKKYLELCDKDLQALNNMAESQQSKAEMESLKAKYESYKAGVHSSVEEKRAGTIKEEGFGQRQAAVKLGQDADELTTQISKIAEMGQQAADSEAKRINDDINSSMIQNIILSVVLIVVSTGIGMLFSRDLSRRMKELGVAAGRIADGDLATEVETSTGDELGDAAASFEIMRQRVHESISEINSAADQVAAGAKNVSDASLSLSQGATEQAASVEELSASITEIASQTANNADNADKANALTIKTREQAEIGNADMNEMLQAMEDINDSSANISKIIKVIDEIAFQTNILALNAAVEAARAGQHGKGFAVVAEEVRNLAARSAKAAKETTDMIEGSINKVNVGRDIANKTAQALNAIVTDVADVADIVGSIAKASNEQKLALDQINQGVQQVSTVVQSNSATSEEAAAASQQLSAQADRMKETVRKFKLGNISRTYAPKISEPRRVMPQEAEMLTGDAEPAPQERSVLRPAAPGVKPKTIALTDDEGFGKY